MKNLSNLHTANSKLMNPELKLYNLFEVNFFLILLGLFPLRKIPSSKILIRFWKKDLSVVVQPVDVWDTELIEIPNLLRRKMEEFESMILIPQKMMHFGFEFHFDGKTDVPVRLISKVNKLEKALKKKGQFRKL